MPRAAVHLAAGLARERGGGARGGASRPASDRRVALPRRWAGACPAERGTGNLILKRHGKLVALYSDKHSMSACTTTVPPACPRA
jgi:hypothetical protein